MAAKAALDAALHDLCGKLAGLPRLEAPRPPAPGPPTSWTVWLGDPDEMARRAEAVRGFRRLKLKLGGADGLDVSGSGPCATSPSCRSWSTSTSTGLSRRRSRRFPSWRPSGSSTSSSRSGRRSGRAGLKRRSPLPIFVDEDCHTLGDVAACAERAHGVNLKLAKAGGIREAVRMAHAARALGLGVMLGCMIESGLAIAAGCCVAPLCDHVDLDGNLLLAEDPWSGVDLVDGVQVPSNDAGLGVHPAAVEGGVSVGAEARDAPRR